MVKQNFVTKQITPRCLKCVAPRSKYCIVIPNESIDMDVMREVLLIGIVAVLDVGIHEG